jgi:hypothetical protein
MSAKAKRLSTKARSHIFYRKSPRCSCGEYPYLKYAGCSTVRVFLLCIEITRAVEVDHSIESNGSRYEDVHMMYYTLPPTRVNAV